MPASAWTADTPGMPDVVSVSRAYGEGFVEEAGERVWRGSGAVLIVTACVRRLC